MQNTIPMQTSAEQMGTT